MIATTDKSAVKSIGHLAVGQHVFVRKPNLHIRGQITQIIQPRCADVAASWVHVMVATDTGTVQVQGFLQKIADALLVVFRHGESVRVFHPMRLSA